MSRLLDNIKSDYTQRGDKLSGKSFALRNFCLKNFLVMQETKFFEIGF
jgi:hypothetical protein